MNLKIKQIEALRRLPRIKALDCVNAQQLLAFLIADLRETVRGYIREMPVFSHTTQEQLSLLLVDRLNRLETDRVIRCGRIAAVWHNDEERMIIYDVEITPIMTQERIIVNLTLTA